MYMYAPDWIVVRGLVMNKEMQEFKVKRKTGQGHSLSRLVEVLWDASLDEVLISTCSRTSKTG